MKHIRLLKTKRYRLMKSDSRQATYSNLHQPLPINGSEEEKMKRILSQIIFQALILLFITSATHADFTLQLASYPYKSNAERHLKSLKAQNYDAFIHIQEREYSDGGFWYKIRLGPFSTRKAALDKKQTMLENGFEGEILLVESPNIVS
jgi:hypothetical protein